MLVRQGGGSIVRRFSDHLPPEETCQVVLFRRGDVSIGDVKVRIAIVIEVPEIRRPGPTAHLNSGLLADVLKPSIALVAIKRIASCVSPIERADLFRRFFMEAALPGNPLPSGRPHVGN